MKVMRILTAAVLFLQTALLPAAPALAQDADRQFLDELQGPSQEGGPILEQGQQSSSPRAQTPGAPIESARIGGVQREAPMYEEAETVSPLDRKIGPIRLKAAPLSTFLDVVSAQSKVNFIITDGLEKTTVTVFLRKTTVREALEILLRVKGLTYQRIGKSNTYVVTKRAADQPNLITKIYTLNYIPLIPVASVVSDIRAISSQDVSSGGGRQMGQGQQPGGQDQQQGGQGAGKEDRTESAIAILNIVNSVLSRKYGKMAVDPRTNSLVITDIAEVFPQVEQIIAELDKKAPQILIEAQIVEINTDRVNELGIEWGGSRGEMAYFAGPARLTDYGLRPGFFRGDQWKFFYPSAAGSAITGGGDTGDTGDTGGETGGGASAIDPIFATGAQGARGIYYGIFSLAQLQAIFRALISRGEARYLGKPKIVSMNNKTAVIQIARDAAVGTGSSVSSAGGATGEATTSLERRRVGLNLQVTPQVNKEGFITMIVQPSYSDITPSAITVQGATVYDPVSRGVSTMVRVKNGQTVVIGGMLSSTETKTVKKVPLLGYIPIVGWLFTSVSSRRTNTDLVIFITPTILVD
ncbi:MAG: type IV pilus assembly protein PilQ [Elusimicrobia bacterium]|nr:MAG: type IV pilus assembly protein PilQ [Elusimicrobiota bacterium]KAF0156572.1 MAG: type IV pilus assembly protein PilQ [Elusimicrobiota bacterium]